MASAGPIYSDHVPNYYQILGVNENASREEIYRAFRLRALEVHPDKNPEDKVGATKEFQLLTRAKIVLLDPEKRQNLDETLIDNGVRNWKALPLLCSICTKAKCKEATKCLKGMGHINPVIEEFRAAATEYKYKMTQKSKKSQSENEFIITLREVLNNFIATDWYRLYPLAANRKQKPRSKEKVSSLRTFPGASYSTSGSNNHKSSVPTAAEVVEILELSLVRSSKGTVPVYPSFMPDFPIYDLSCLSDSELERIRQYFCLASEKPSSRDLAIKELNLIIPKCTVKSRSSGEQQRRPRHVCQQCGRTRFSSAIFFFSPFLSCFVCEAVCCRDCLSSTDRKISTSGSYDLRKICKTCLTAFRSREAATWLTHGHYLFRTDAKYLEVAIAMYNLSNELLPSDNAVIKQARALLSCEKYEQLVKYGKEVLCTTSLEQENAQELQKMVAESLMKIANDTDDSDLLMKADKYEEAINWTAQLTEEDGGEFGAAVHDLKVEAMRRRQHCFEVHERDKMRRVNMLFSNVIAAVREGSLLKVFLLLQDMDEEIKLACSKQLSKESQETYSQYGKLLLRLVETMVTFDVNPADAISQMADIFWSGYSLFLEKNSREHIFDFVIRFTCQLLQGSNSLLLEKLQEISPTNFLQCLHLTENDLLSPPDIEKRLWENFSVEGCNMKMFLKYELAVKKLSETKKWSPFKVALFYYDLTFACNHPSQLLATLITSAQWFARQLSSPNSNDALKYWCKQMIMKLTNSTAGLAFEFGIHPHMQYYLARMVVGLQFYASSKAPLGSQDDATIIGTHLKWLVASGRLCPLHKMPIVSPTESVLLDVISRDLYSEYLLKLQDKLPPEWRPVSEAVLRYHLYENYWFKRCPLQDPTGNGLRLTAMTELLHAEGWSWDGVQQHLQWNMVPLDSEGWLVSNHPLLEPVASSGVHQLVGLEINKNDFSVHLLIREKSRRSPSLLCWEDIAMGLTINPGCFFSLEAVTPQETLYHPFNKQIYEPKELQASRLLNTLFHTDYLLKQFSTGFEISSYPPFDKRPVHEGLLKGLPKTLQESLLPIHKRGHSLSRVHRFWIQADEMEYDVHENENSVRWLFGDVHMNVRCKPMFHTQDGELRDQDVEGPDPDSPEGSFVADFNKNYDQIGKYFPEFLRLKELCKAQFLGTFVSSFEESLGEQRRRFESEEMRAKYREIYSSTLEKAQDDIEKTLNDLLGKIKRETGWFISEEVIRQVHQQGSIPAPYTEIYNWMRNDDPRAIAKRMARERVPSVQKIKQHIIDDHIAKLGRCQSSFSALKNNCKRVIHSTHLVNECCWVPAVCHSGDGKLIYGGVTLTPKTHKVTLPQGRHVNRVPLTSTFHGFREKVKPPSVKPFTPPRTNARKVAPSSGPPGDGSGGGSSSGDSDSDSNSCERRGNLSEKGGDTCNRGNATHGQLQKDTEVTRKLFGLNEENRIRKGKKSPKCEQYHLPCWPKRNAGETVLLAFSSLGRVHPGKESPRDKDQPDKSVESALMSIKQGRNPWQNSQFGFIGQVKPPGGEFTWTIIARNSSDDKRPTLELQRLVSLNGKNVKKRIKIRFGDELE